MAKQQKKPTDPRIAATLLAAITIMVLGINAAVGSYIQHPTWQGVLVGLGMMGIGGGYFAVASSYGRFDQIVYALLGYFAVALGFVVTCAGLLAQLPGAFGFVAMWAVQLFVVGAVLLVVEMGIAIKSIDGPHPAKASELGFGRAAISRSGRWWFIGLCLGAMALLISIDLLQP